MFMKRIINRVICTLLTLSLTSSGFFYGVINVMAEEAPEKIAVETEEKSEKIDSDNEDVAEEIENKVEEIQEEKEDEKSESEELKKDETSEAEEESEEEDTEESEEKSKEKRHVKVKKLNDLGYDAISSATQSKFSSELNFRSAKSYGGLYEEKFEGAAYLKTAEGEEEGAFVAVGYTFGASEDPKWDFAPNMEAYPRVGHSYNEAIIVRFDEDHAVDWVWESDRIGVSYFLAVDVIDDGSIIAVGRCRDYESTRTALYLVRINPDDPTDYTEYIINSNSGAGYEFNGIVATDDGGFAVTGFTSFLDGYIASKVAGEASFSEKTQIWQNADGDIEDLSKRVSVKGYNGFLMKFDKEMNVEYTSFENYGATEGVADPGYSSIGGKILNLDLDADGNFVTVGLAQLSKGNVNAIISKWDSATGELIAHRMAGTDDAMKQSSIDLIDARYLSVATLADGTYVTTGVVTNDATTAEGWKCYGSTDVVVVRYSSDLSEVLYTRNIGTVDGLSGSMTTNNGTEMEGVKATTDGGYILYGTSNTKLVERDLLDEGYTWDNYGSNDGIIIKCDKDNKVTWCKNYGTTGGDWIYDVIFRTNETEVTVVGQTSGQYGTPAWEWHGQAASSTNPYDAFVMTTNMYSAAYTEPKNTSSELSGVTWANGTYEGEGVGRGGTMVMEVVIENNIIASIQCKSNNETSSIFEKAKALFDSIINQQSPEVDSISGATLSSSGIKTGVSQALAKASAQTAINAITKVSGYTSANTASTGNINNVLAAINYYTALTDYEREYVTNSDKLYEVAEIFGFEVQLEKSEGEKSAEEIDTAFNDTYWNLQSKYYRQMNPQAFSANGLTGKGVKIAVIDSGVIGNSADLDYRHILAGWDYINDVPMNDSEAENNEALTDAEGHGTLVAGIIAAVQNNGTGIAGLLSEVDLIPIRIASGESEEASVKVAQAIRDAVDKFGVDVITTSVSLADTTELKSAVEYAASKGVIIIGASGNSGVAGSVEDAYVYPASYDDVISVGAVDGSGNVRINSTKNDKVFVTAPGQQIVSLGLSAKGYRCYVKSGTSYSAPVVAAMAAAAKQIDKKLTTEGFKKLLKKTSQDKGDKGHDNSYGYGVVDFEAFAKAIVPDKSIEPNASTNKSTSSSSSSSAAKTEKATITISENEETVPKAKLADSSEPKNNFETKKADKKATENSINEELEEEEVVPSSPVEDASESVEESDSEEEIAEDMSQSSEEAKTTESSLPLMPIVLIVLGLAVAIGIIIKYLKK